MKVFISGPYTSGDVVINVRNAVLMAEKVIEKGHIPFVPHLNHLWHLISPHEDIEFWYSFDLKWLRVCDILLRLPGKSIAADKEVRYALTHSKRVIHDINEL